MDGVVASQADHGARTASVGGASRIGKAIGLGAISPLRRSVEASGAHARSAKRILEGADSLTASHPQG